MSKGIVKSGYYLSERTMHLTYARLNQSVEPGPLAAMTQRDQVLTTLDEIFFRLIVQRLDVPEPSPKAMVVPV